MAAEMKRRGITGRRGGTMTHQQLSEVLGRFRAPPRNPSDRVAQAGERAAELDAVPLRKMAACALLLFPLAASCAFAANDWVSAATFKPGAALPANRLCYTDGVDIACDGAAGLLSTSGTFVITNISATNLTVGGNAVLTSAALSGTLANNDLTDAITDIYGNMMLGGGASNGMVPDPGNVTGVSNAVIGMGSFLGNSEGNFNTGLGARVLRFNTTGSDNTAIGNEALYNNGAAGGNTGIGSKALTANTSGNLNTALGYNEVPQRRRVEKTSAHASFPARESQRPFAWRSRAPQREEWSRLSLRRCTSLAWSAMLPG